MARYSKEFKEKIAQKMMPPNSASVAQIHRETGVSGPTLYNWKNNFQQRGMAVPADPSNPENWSGIDKLAVINETASFNQQELSEYCRKKGLYVEQILRWKDQAVSGLVTPGTLNKEEKTQWKKGKKEIRQLKKELYRKEKALAETAALLVLKKKVQDLWGESEEE